MIVPTSAKVGIARFYFQQPQGCQTPPGLRTSRGFCLRPPLEPPVNDRRPLANPPLECWRVANSAELDQRTDDYIFQYRRYGDRRRPISTTIVVAMITIPTLTNPTVTTPSCHPAAWCPAEVIGDIAAAPNTAASVVTAQFAYVP
jgi:hypothetical protein